MTTLLEQLTVLAEDAARTHGCTLVDLEVSQGKGSWIIRVFLDKIPDGVTIRDCGLVSDMLSSLLDVHDPIPGKYLLEVSSPGVNRPLKKKEDFQRFIGCTALIQTALPPDPADGRRRFQGCLAGVDGEAVVMTVETGNVTLALQEITQAHLVFSPPAKGKKAKTSHKTDKPGASAKTNRKPVPILTSGETNEL